MPEKLNNMIGSAVEEERKKHARWLRLSVAGAALILGAFAATQYFAHVFGYDPVLGWNYDKVYFPGMIFWWAAQWRHIYPKEFTACASIGILVSGGIMLAYLVLARIASQSAYGNKYLHGSAHWASLKEIKKSGVLRKKKGVYVGAWQDKNGVTHYLRDSGPSHVLCFAPTRSGKGVGLVLPTLLSWEESAIVADLKGELWDLTAGWRQKYAKNKAIRFEPGQPDGSARWNPFDEIRVGTAFEAADISALAMIIVDPEGKGLEDHWARTACDFLEGCIAHLLYKRKREGTPANMGALDRMLADPTLPLADLYKQMVSYSHFDDGTPHPLSMTSGQKMLDKPDNERGSVVSTAQSFLRIYRDPVVARNTEASDFHLLDLMNHRDPVSLYLITTPDNKARLRPLIRLLVYCT